LLTISIINYRNADETARCLGDLEGIGSELPYRVIIRDNSPTPQKGELEDLSRQSKLRVEICYSSDNPGFGRGHNLNFFELKHGSGDQFLILNNDVRIPDLQVIRSMAELCQRGTLASCSIVKGDGSGWFMGGNISSVTGDLAISREKFSERSRECDFLTGCCLMASVEDFTLLGGFDESFFMYAEDLDLSVRARRAGLTLRVVREEIVHVVGSGERGKYSDLYIYENTKNRLICLRRFRFGPPLVREAYFVAKYGFVRVLQLAIFSSNPVRQIRELIKAFRDGCSPSVKIESRPAGMKGRASS
jgi:GT2 family glycosyltransferase